MKRFIEGANREQSTLLPESLDEWIDDSNPVRAVDVFVDGLNLVKLGFDGVVPEATGRPSYHPSALLKLYIYGTHRVARRKRKKRREKGLARAGNARVRRGMIQLAWRFLDYQKESALAKWFQARTENARGSRKKMIVALARKLLIALWHFIRDGVVPEGVVLRPAH